MSDPVKIVTCDGKQFDLSEDDVRRSVLLRNAVADLGADAVIPIPSVNSATFQAIYDFMKCTSGDKADFLGRLLVKGAILKDLLLAAQYLEINELTEALSQFIGANIATAHGPAEMKSRLRLRGDLPPQRTADLQKALNWTNV